MTFVGGLPETKCGGGSTIQATRHIREWLPIIFNELDIRVLVDAPCGDFNWMARTDLSDIEYYGVDYDIEHLRKAVAMLSEPERFAPLDAHFLLLNILSDDIPDGDAIMCKDFFQHIPTKKVIYLLDKITKFRWLIATCHNNHHNDDLAYDGGFRPLNLRIAPFNLGDPLHKVENDKKVLGVWECG